MKLLKKHPIFFLILAFAATMALRELFPNIHENIQDIYVKFIQYCLQIISPETVHKVSGSELSLKLLVFMFLSIITLPLKWHQKTWLLPSSILFLLTINVVRIAYFFNDSRQGNLFYEQESFIVYHLVIAILLFFLWNYGLIKKAIPPFQQIKSQTKPVNIYSLGYLFVIAFLLLYIFRFAIQFFPQTTLTIYTFLVDFILNLSKQLLNLFNYPAVVEGKRIFDSHTEIIMNFPCIGINLLMVYILFIVVAPGSFTKKIYFFVFGWAVLIFVNVVRITLLYAFLYDGVKSVANIDWHDLFNMLVYASIFLLWMSWFSPSEIKK